MSDRLTAPCDVLVRGSTIAKVGDDAGEAPAGTPSAGGSGGTVQEFDGSGHVLMPGLIDAHYHVAFSTMSLAELSTADPGYLGIRTAAAARETLLRGFTTVRDVGGPVFG